MFLVRDTRGDVRGYTRFGSPAVLDRHDEESVGYENS
jgi:hypothetical protein